MTESSSSGSDSDVIVELNGKTYYLTCRLCFEKRDCDEYAFMPCRNCLKYSICSLCYSQYRQDKSTCPHCQQPYDDIFINSLQAVYDANIERAIRQILIDRKAAPKERPVSQSKPPIVGQIPPQQSAPQPRPPAQAASHPRRDQKQPPPRPQLLGESNRQPKWRPMKSLDKVSPRHKHIDHKCVHVRDIHRHWNEMFARSLFPKGKKSRYRLKNAYRLDEDPNWFVLLMQSNVAESIVNGLARNDISSKLVCASLCDDQLQYMKFKKREESQQQSRKKKKKKRKQGPAACPFQNDRERCPKYHNEINFADLFDPAEVEERDFLIDRHNLLLRGGKLKNAAFEFKEQFPPEMQRGGRPPQPPPTKANPRPAFPNVPPQFRGRGNGRLRARGRRGAPWGRNVHEAREMPKRSLAENEEAKEADEEDFPALPKIDDGSKDDFNDLYLQPSEEMQRNIAEKYFRHRMQNKIESLQKNAWKVKRPQPRPVAAKKKPQQGAKRRSEDASPPPGLAPPGLGKKQPRRPVKPPQRAKAPPKPEERPEEPPSPSEVTPGWGPPPPVGKPSPKRDHVPRVQHPPPPVQRQPRVAKPPPPVPHQPQVDSNGESTASEDSYDEDKWAPVRDQILNNFDPNLPREEMESWPLEILNLFLQKLKENQVQNERDDDGKKSELDETETTPQRAHGGPVMFGYDDVEEDYQPFPTTETGESNQTPAYANAYATFSRANDPYSNSYNNFGPSDPPDDWVHTTYDGDNEYDEQSEMETEDIRRFTSDLPIEDFDQLNSTELEICQELRIRTMYDFANMGRKFKKKFIRKMKQRWPNRKNVIRAHQLFNTARNYLNEFEMQAKYAREQETEGGETAWGGVDYSTTIGFFKKYTDSAGFTKSSAVRKGQVAHVGTGGGVMDRENDNRNLSYLDQVVPKIIRQKKCFSISEFAQVFKRHTGGQTWNMYWNGANLVELLKRYERNGDCDITCRGASDFVITSKDFNSPKKQPASNARWNSRPDATATYSKIGGRTPPPSPNKKRKRKKKQKIVMPTTPPSSDYSD